VLATPRVGRRGGGGRSPATTVAGLQLAVAATEGGCASAEAAASEWFGWAATFDADPDHIRQVFAAASPVTGCDL
jgi:hypothetical protein